ncbi:MAG: hypothetical protein OXQ89_02940 [Rhodospirillaceae bacterium]|nr:hypothetical protein [Rhodospirillaceae bacterium]MDD9996680.1 hypothetical protein [Rhodospirillaceae bacterium]MDE0363770.1 hypothetical protein [Rhodospirillaceae bacterium]
MADPAFDTLEAARRLEAGGIQAEEADAIVDVVKQSTGQMVTVERFDAAVNRLDTAIAGLHARIDSVQSELSAKIDSVGSRVQAALSRSLLIAVGIIIAAIALMATIFGVLLTNGAFGIVTFGTP